MYPVPLFVFREKDPYRNLAAEEILFETLLPGQEVYLLYVNSPCVVLGKNQNPWRETSPERLRRAEIPLLRRKTGGGTVWHDAGNINFSWMGPKKEYNRAKVDAWVGAALEFFGLKFDISPLGDYSYSGGKFSGNAFAFRGDRAMHHGTLLVASDLARLKTFMGGVNFPKSVGTASRPASVLNLSEVLPELSVEGMLQALCQACPGNRSEVPVLPGLDDLARTRASDAWVLGETPVFYIPDASGALREIRGGRWKGRYFSLEGVIDDES